MTTKKKSELKKTWTRIMCLSLAGLMVLSTLIAAVLSQVW